MPKTPIAAAQTICSQIPATVKASSAPGQGGIVTATASSGSSPSQRNWKCVPVGIVIETPGVTSTISSRSPSLRHTRPRPPVKHQISSTVRCATARDTAPGLSRKAAILPRANEPSRRTSEPSGATASGAAPIFFVSKVIGGTSRRSNHQSTIVPPIARLLYLQQVYSNLTSWLNHVGFLLWSAGYTDSEANQRASRFSSRPARRWRDSALPRWFGRTVSPNFRERYLRRSSALAPLACALTAFSVTSPSDAAGACRRACASGFLAAVG